MAPRQMDAMIDGYVSATSSTGSDVYRSIPIHTTLQKRTGRAEDGHFGKPPAESHPSLCFVHVVLKCHKQLRYMIPTPLEQEEKIPSALNDVSHRGTLSI